MVIPLIARNRWKVPTGSKRKNEESVEEQIAQTDGEADEAKLALLKGKIIY